MNLPQISLSIKQLKAPTSIAPLVVFRILFATMMLASIVRFILKGWVNDLYVKPTFFFSYYGFEWVKPLGEKGMYILFGIMTISALMMLVGLLYRFAAILFFMTFTYVELIDKSTYLNHYYFVSIVSLLLILLPAGRHFSLDVFWRPKNTITHIPRWMNIIIPLQLGIVYFYAGLAKLNHDWLFEAQPLSIWLQAQTNLPLIGFLMDKKWIAYFFSWFGALYDLTIPFLLVYGRTRALAYFLVISFHLMTGFLFQIGMFPYIMIVCTCSFFSENFHVKTLNKLKQFFKALNFKKQEEIQVIKLKIKPLGYQLLVGLFCFHFCFQLLFPWRFLLYPGKLFWTEQGYRFSWRVMLMEKAGKAYFYVNEKGSDKKIEVIPGDYLSINQEKMMATQPDMILQFAHYIKDKYQTMGINNAEVRVESYVTLNGSGSKLFIDPKIDLSTQKESFANKTWILPF